jgi:hypothetical protein
MLLGASNMIIGDAPNPIIIRMARGAVLHHFGDNFERLGRKVAVP